MIVDCLANGEKYELGDTWPLIVEFLKGLDEVSEERKYVVQEDAIFGRVATIHTGTAEESVLEAHRTYVDIHVVLNGVERLDWFPLEGLCKGVSPRVQRGQSS